MAPIYDSDLAEERFSKNEWNQYELWEKVEVRLRWRKRLWIAAACVGYLCLSSIPVVMDRMPRWKALTATRHLAEQINRIKLEAASSHSAYRIRFKGDGQLSYVVERTPSCSAGTSEVVRSGELMHETEAGQYVLVGPSQGNDLGIGGFFESFCYDYLSGSDVVLRGENLAGFGVMPVNDLTSKRTDRLAVLVVTGPSAEITFE
jgi:hypothetical protein